MHLYMQSQVRAGPASRPRLPGLSSWGKWPPLITCSASAPGSYLSGPLPPSASRRLYSCPVVGAFFSFSSAPQRKLPCGQRPYAHGDSAVPTGRRDHDPGVSAVPLRPPHHPLQD